MARPPEQSPTGLQRDRADLFRILERARQNKDRPKELNEELVKHLSEAHVILAREPEHYESSTSVGNGAAKAAKNGERRASR